MLLREYCPTTTLAPDNLHYIKRHKNKFSLTMQTNIEEFGNNLRKLLENIDFSPIFPAIEAVCHASVIQNFSF